MNSSQVMPQRHLGPRSKNVYSIKSQISNGSKLYNMHGPWRPTVNEAVLAFVEKLRKKRHENWGIEFPFVALRATIQEQIGSNLRSDPDGVPYRHAFGLDATIAPLLIAQGLTISSNRVTNDLP